MASRAEVLNLSNAEEAMTWLTSFQALARVKKWNDTEENNDVTDNFLSLCGTVALQKIINLVAPDNIEKMTFKEIYENLSCYLKPKNYIVIAERTKFHSLKQEDNESVMDFLCRLRCAAKTCKFDELKRVTDPAEEMVKVAFVAGLYDRELKERILNTIVSHESMSTEMIQNLIIQNNSIRNFTVQEIKKESEINFVKKNKYQSSKGFIRNCKFCGGSHLVRECPAYGKKCTSCGKTNHFSKVCQSKDKGINSVDANDNVQDYPEFLNSPSQGLLHVTEVNSIDEEMEMFNINGKSVKMQVDTGASATIISSKIWQDLKSPSLSKYHRALEAYDGHKFNVLGKFKAEVELESKFKLSDIIVIASDKSYGLLGRDLIDNFEPINAVQSNNSKVSEEYLPVIKGVKAKMELISGAKDIFCKARPVPIPLESKVESEIKRLERMGIITPIEHATNASPVVWIKKKNGDLRMCADYKIHVNAK